MITHALTPILNVSDITESFAWFERLGWKKGWEWGTPPTFGGVCSGKVEIFLCEGAQGGRGKGTNTSTFGPGGDEDSDKGVWISMWVDNVDEIYEHCLKNDIEVVFTPHDMPWGVREMHVRHPDGHVFRIGRGTNEEEHEES